MKQPEKGGSCLKIIVIVEYVV